MLLMGKKVYVCVRRNESINKEKAIKPHWKKEKYAMEWLQSALSQVNRHGASNKNNIKAQNKNIINSNTNTNKEPTTNKRK